MTFRDATTHWEGGLRGGSGGVTLDSSGAGHFGVCYPTRTGHPDAQTSPEELLAAAHSSCLAMSLAAVLGAENLTPESIDVSAEVALAPDADGNLRIPSIRITLRAEVDGVDPERFVRLAHAAERSCPLSRALTGVTITLDAGLAP